MTRTTPNYFQERILVQREAPGYLNPWYQDHTTRSEMVTQAAWAFHKIERGEYLPGQHMGPSWWGPSVNTRAVCREIFLDRLAKQENLPGETPRPPKKTYNSAYRKALERDAAQAAAQLRNWRPKTRAQYADKNTMFIANIYPQLPTEAEGYRLGWVTLERLAITVEKRGWQGDALAIFYSWADLPDFPRPKLRTRTGFPLYDAAEIWAWFFG